jgi:hypothetical protein
MPITINQNSEPDRVVSSHWIHYPIPGGPEPGGRWLLTLSGVALVDFRGGTSGFSRDEIILDLDIRGPQTLWPAPPPPPAAGASYYWDPEMVQWAPFATINSFGASGSTGAGYAVDTVESGSVAQIRIGVAVRESQAVLWRVGYHATWIFDLLVALQPG